MRFIEMSDYNRRARACWWVITLAGAFAIIFAARAIQHLDKVGLLQVAVLLCLTMLAGLCPIRIPGTQALITPGEIFIFLTALLFGAPAATLVAATDAFVTSCRGSQRWTSRLGSPAMAAIAMLISASLFHQTLNLLHRFSAAGTGALLFALLIFSLVHFLLNSLLLTITFALKQQTSLLPLWWANYCWAGLTYLASASAAGLIYLSIRQHGLISLLAAAPLVAIVFATCHFYFKQSEERAKADHERAEAAAAQVAQTERHLQELQKREEKFRRAFDYASTGMALVAADGKWLQVNRSLCHILGYGETELLALTFQTLTHLDDLDHVRRSVAQLLAEETPATQIELRFLHRLGHEVWTLLSASIFHDTHDDSPRLIFQIQNITDRKRAEDQLLHDAFHDALTGLPNRALFLDHLKLALARAQRHHDRAFAVLFLDFDRFKIVNDSLGHLTGDQLLVAIAQRLESCLRPGDTVARLGGDEFTILLEDLGDADEAIALAERLQKELTAPFNLNGHEVFTSASIGIARGSFAYQKPEEILRDADAAMYHAKSRGKAQHALFNESMHTRAMKQLQLETDLRHALERREFFLVYQPVVSLQTARLEGFEALVRWRHPERGLISPADFIPVAEETNLIIPLGQWVLDEACRQMHQWQELCRQRLALTMSVNLSGKQLTQSSLIERILQTLHRTGLAPQQLKLEITESVVMENIETATGMLEQLRALGVQLSIDDFGTGYSSLSYLHRLPIDTLKIDRSFVIRMVESNENAEIVRTIVTLAKTLKMSVVAEGVETTEQMERLRRLDCEMGQGYLFARPMEAEAATQLVKQRNEWQAFNLPAEPAWQLENVAVPLSRYAM